MSGPGNLLRSWSLISKGFFERPMSKLCAAEAFGLGLEKRPKSGQLSVRGVCSFDSASFGWDPLAACEALAKQALG